MHKIDWCKGGMQLADIATNHVGDNYLNPRTRYIMVRLDNWDKTLVQKVLKDTGYSIDQDLFMNRLD